jgi:hypothetical protein
MAPGWTQQQLADLTDYEVEVSPDSSFLEMLDELNNLHWKKKVKTL